MARLALGLLALATGCGSLPQLSVEDACHMVQLHRSELGQVGGRDLVTLSHDTPAEADARSAYTQQVTGVVAAWIGAAALAAGFIDGFAADPARNMAARDAAYGLAAGAVALFALRLTLGYTGGRAADRARRTLAEWAEHCP
jgi:hypothetical protein